MPSQLNISFADVEQFCKRWQLVEFAYFGSAARGELNARSDIDVMVTFADSARPTLLDLARMRRELEEASGRKVDLLTRRSVERSTNQIRKQSILTGMETIYAA